MNHSLECVGLFFCSIGFVLTSTTTICAQEALVGGGSLVWKSSFENDADPLFRPAALSGQNGWTRIGPMPARATVVHGGQDGHPSAPDGVQMIALDSIGEGVPYADLVFTEDPLTNNFRFSVTLAFVGEIQKGDENSVLARVYLNHADHPWEGIHFGIWRENGANRFFYTANSQTNDFVSTFGPVAEQGVFYRITLEGDVSRQLYSIQVSDSASGTILAKEEYGVFRGRKPAAINFLRLNSPSAGDGVVAYFDDITIEGTSSL